MKDEPKTEADGIRAEAIRRAQVRQRIASRPVTMEQLQEREQRRKALEHKRAEAIANAERDAPIRARFHAWLERAGFRTFPIPQPGQSYPGSHIEAMWEAYLDATLQERNTAPTSPWG